MHWFCWCFDSFLSGRFFAYVGDVEFAVNVGDESWIRQICNILCWNFQSVIKEYPDKPDITQELSWSKLNWIHHELSGPVAVLRIANSRGKQAQIHIKIHFYNFYTLFFFFKQIKFEEEFTKWELNFKNWQRQNQQNTHHSSYKQYEQKFLEIRDKLLMKRTQIYSKPQIGDIRQDYEFQLAKAANAAEEILRRFPVNSVGPMNMPGPSFGFNNRMPGNFGPNFGRPGINNPRPMANNNRGMQQQQQQKPSWKPPTTQQPSSDYPNEAW